MATSSDGRPRLDLTLTSLADNLALDEALLLAAEEGESGEVLRFWQWPSLAVVLGAAGILADDVIESACVADGVPVGRRSSGGGTVLLGPGCFCYSLVLDTHTDRRLQQITTSYQMILGCLAEALSGLLPGLMMAGSSDLVCNGRKVGGNSQQRKRRFVLHHGTLLYDFDLTAIGRYLTLPPRRPDYRGDRSHSEFLLNIPTTAETIRERVARAWNAISALPSWPEDRVHKLVAEKYGQPEWTRRR
jgi:lipoate-protein ligase A